MIKDKSLIHDVEVLLIRILPLYLRYLTRQRGALQERQVHGPKESKQNTEVHCSPEIHAVGQVNIASEMGHS